MSAKTVATLKEKLAVLQQEWAITADRAKKFQLEKEIEETKEGIATLEGNPKPPPDGEKPPPKSWLIWLVVCAVLAFFLGIGIGWVIFDPNDATAALQLKEKELLDLNKKVAALTVKEQELQQFHEVIGKLGARELDLQRAVKDAKIHSPLDASLRKLWGDDQHFEQQWNSLRAKENELAFRVLQLGPLENATGGPIQVLFGAHCKVRYQVFTKEKADARPGDTVIPQAPLSGTNPMEIKLPASNEGATLFILVSLLPPDTREFNPGSDKDWYNLVNIRRAPR